MISIERTIEGYILRLIRIRLFVCSGSGQSQTRRRNPVMNTLLIKEGQSLIFFYVVFCAVHYEAL